MQQWGYSVQYSRQYLFSIHLSFFCAVETVSRLDHENLDHLGHLTSPSTAKQQKTERGRDRMSSTSYPSSYPTGFPSAVPTTSPTPAPTKGNESSSTPIVLLILFTNLLGIYFLLFIYFVAGNMLYLDELKGKVVKAFKDQLPNEESTTDLDVVMTLTARNQPLDIPSAVVSNLHDTASPYSTF